MNRVGRVMRGGLLVTFWGAVACAHSGTVAGHAPASTASGPAAPSAPPPSSGAPASKAAVRRPQPLVPSGAAATVYASTEPPDGAKAPADPLRDAIRAAVREGARKAGIPTPEVEGRLDLAMNDLARALGPEDMPAPEAVDFLLAHYGLPDPSPEWLIQRAPLGSDGEVAEQTAPQVLETLKAMQAARLGIGVDRSSGELRVVIGVQAREV